MRTAPEIPLPIRIDPNSAVPLPTQLAAQVRDLVHEGVLSGGNRLPSTRALADILQVSRGTVQVAYEQLLVEGYLLARPGSGTEVHPKLHRRVHRDLAPNAAVTQIQSHAEGYLDLRPGAPSHETLANPAWRRVWRDAVTAGLDEKIPPLGHWGFRAAIAEHLWRHRGVDCSPNQIVVTSGAREGMTVLLTALGGELTVGLENPGYPALRRVPGRFGARVVYLPADNQGLLTETLPTPAPDIVVTTPSHQYPLGGSLPLNRRVALLDWARAEDVLVVEDDYDSELRYTSQPVPALAVLGKDRVALLGTFSKTLTPAVSAGFLLLPERLVPAVAAIRGDLGQPVSAITQRALSAYLGDGELSRHMARMRRGYRERRQLVLTAFANSRVATASPMAGGMHMVVDFDRDEDSVVAELLARRVRVTPLSDYWADASPRKGIVIGFASVSMTDLSRAVRECREVIESGTK